MPVTEMHDAEMPARRHGFFRMWLGALVDPFRYARYFLICLAPWFLLQYGRIALDYVRATDHASFAYKAAPWLQWLVAALTGVAFLGFAILWLRHSYLQPGHDRAVPSERTHWRSRAARWLWLSLVVWVILAAFFKFAHPRIMFEGRWTMMRAGYPDQAIWWLQSVYLLAFVLVGARFTTLFASAAVDEVWLRGIRAWRFGKGQTRRTLAALVLFTPLVAMIKYAIIVSPGSLDLNFFSFLVANPYRSFTPYVYDGTWREVAETFAGCLGIAWIVGFIGRSYRHIADRWAVAQAREMF